MRESDGPRDPDTPSLTTLTVSPEQVAAVPGMSDLIESIRQYVTPDRPENGAGNVAIVFSAIFTALRTGGVTMERNRLALSHFQFGFRGEGYEIPLSLSLLHAASQTQPLDASGASPGSVDRRSPRKRKHAKAAAQEACTRHTLLLKKLFERVEAASGDSRTLARHLSGQGRSIFRVSPVAGHDHGFCSGRTARRAAGSRVRVQEGDEKSLRSLRAARGFLRRTCRSCLPGHTTVGRNEGVSPKVFRDFGGRYDSLDKAGRAESACSRQALGAGKEDSSACALLRRASPDQRSSDDASGRQNHVPIVLYPPARSSSSSTRK
ncbi:uncharacterized protein PSANT_07006 [Moesziomyces antarcticus]|uniref:Uncharacterized protein n=1 Tax=Pseudozyma antarctica TaxID=84753 RepID=A0A5C3FY94_PSEA2|nr:uncharacterized protein PSANT_07006 [Moesziomyces antarcticus]